MTNRAEQMLPVRLPSDTAAEALLGNKLVAGAQYFRTSDGVIREYDGTVWGTVASATVLAYGGSGVIPNGKVLASAGFTLVNGNEYLIAIAASNDAAPILAAEVDASDDFNIVTESLENPYVEFVTALNAGTVNPLQEGVAAVSLKMQTVGIGNRDIVAAFALNDLNGGVIILRVRNDGEVLVGHENNGGASSGNGAFVIYGQVPVTLDPPDVFTLFGETPLDTEEFDDWFGSFFSDLTPTEEVNEEFTDWHGSFWTGKTYNVLTTEDFETGWPT